LLEFAITIPGDFTRRVIRGDDPQILVEADASDPAATQGAVAALSGLPAQALERDLNGLPAPRGMVAQPFSVVVHNRYNPDSITAYNIVPGLLGIILSLTLVQIHKPLGAAILVLALIRLVVRLKDGAPALPADLPEPIKLAAKLSHYALYALMIAMPLIGWGMLSAASYPVVLFGAVHLPPILPLDAKLHAVLWSAHQYLAFLFFAVILMHLAAALFHVPMQGGWIGLGAGVFLFIVGSLALGFLISTLARSQLQAMQMAVFYILPSILLSGFLFPFRGMPGWAQALGSLIPVTHFVRIVRGALLKAQTLGDAIPSLAALSIIVCVVAALAIARYQRTLD